jgi:phosphonate transport system ATP-binding protein
VDPVTTEHVLGTLLDLNREGATLLINLHDVELARRFPRVVALRDGSVAFDGPPERLAEDELAKIYAGDRYGKKVFDDPQVRPRPEDRMRVTEGRDGVSSH